MNEAALAALDLLELNAAHVVSEYSKWYFINAIVMIILALSIGVAGLGLLIRLGNEETTMDTVTRSLLQAICGVLIFLALAIFATNVPTLVEPEARAIHGLIKDIRG